MPRFDINLGFKLDQLTVNATILVLLACYIVYGLVVKQDTRRRALPVHKEWVVILGASKGIGKALALAYAERGARVMLVARDSVELEATAQACRAIKPRHSQLKLNPSRGIETVQADVASEEGLLAVHQKAKELWGCVDTLIICVGALAVLPAFALTGSIDPASPLHVVRDTVSAEELKQATAVYDKMVKLNATVPLLATLTFAPLMAAKSHAPRIALISSVAACIPAPTRAIYASSKSAGTMLMEALRIEMQGWPTAKSRNGRNGHPFGVTVISPATVETGLREQAADMHLAPDGHKPSGSSKGLSPDHVARATISAIDHEQRHSFVPSFYWYARLLHVIIPNVIERGARRKYGFM
ncbi:uncharacterized protein L969DRAFT_101957 [Mixia osmundae IAM 14324]|uniref:NAD(P)-binding protein n=1 Tax=Mixia osmundae (strain CBS 9802 / IAM 14324 / JCM 22182 / KY 12970) TaxID=764103 RepID=G7DU11_MIXOS|nr:uncharacterized protein L969DRAFT_101957 [Mixia osmundae IAM 14324]KEI41784.1 hypothetical protein L969DRAFT_101957 [Mixia osmundae IAM 14324]GAA94071.1 hypothetical protein E5Q_00718 [Mixia osmundae IAM 14324]